MNELDIIHLNMKLGALFRRQRHSDELKEGLIDDAEAKGSQQSFRGHGGSWLFLPMRGRCRRTSWRKSLGYVRSL